MLLFTDFSHFYGVNNYYLDINYLIKMNRQK